MRHLSFRDVKSPVSFIHPTIVAGEVDQIKKAMESKNFGSEMMAQVIDAVDAGRKETMVALERAIVEECKTTGLSAAQLVEAGYTINPLLEGGYELRRPRGGVDLTRDL